MITFGESIRKHRRAVGLSQLALATKIGMTKKNGYSKFGADTP